jgi:hypothetical protein
MVTVDNSVDRAAAPGGGRWQHPRLLLLLGALAFGLSLNAAVKGNLFSDQPPGKGIELFDEAALVKSAPGMTVQNLERLKTCGRIRQIVETACGLSRRDRLAEGVEQCIAYELKYTLWSAYGCQR